jgi:nitrite reductase (NADH) small subunit
MSQAASVPTPGANAPSPSGQQSEHVVCKVEELPPGGRKIVQVRRQQIGVYNVNGTYYALHSMCPHQFGPLCHGPVGGEMICNAQTRWHFEWTRNGEILSCPWHGMEFDLTTGQSLTLKDMHVRTYPVRVVDGEIRVQLGKRATQES